MRSPRVAWLALALAVGCTRSNGSPDDSRKDGGEKPSFDTLALAKAEDSRRANDVPPEVRTSHDVAARRRSARALARIEGAESIDGLTHHLADEDGEVVAWAAYGLGHACKGRESAHVAMLAARGASLPTTQSESARGRGIAELDPYVSIARAIGRCAGPLSEQLLTSLLTSSARTGGAWREPAVLGLGDLATRRKQLGAEAMTALLDAAGDKSAPLDLAFYALSRVAPSDAFSKRVRDAAHRALERRGEARIFAIRTVGRAGKLTPADATDALTRVLVDAKEFEHGERAEAVRALAELGDPGQTSIAEAIGELTPDAKDSVAIANLTGPSFHVLYALLSELRIDVPKKIESAVSVLANLTPPATPTPGTARRLANIRCTAALALARGAYDADVLIKCDDERTEIAQLARLEALLRRPLNRERLAVLRGFANSEHFRVREAVIEGLGSHPEVGEAGAAILADALTSKHAGLVATAAEMIHAHPERALVLAASERRAALDPKAPPPTSSPAQELAEGVSNALTAALEHTWPEDRFETRIALVEAAASVHHPKAQEVASRSCGDPNPMIRERAQKVLRSLGAPLTGCSDVSRSPDVAKELGTTLERQAKVVFTTDAGELSIALEPELSPVTATRIASLVKTGFYTGIVVHRVVPGFVVQFGDPDGDGYGGAGTSLRCETSPVPFHRLDVGMALSGRDTGSSQLFVTLSRTPHLDGEYTRVGRAEGDWASVAQGDAITNARLVE